jgi:hypothetical protein
VACDFRMVTRNYVISELSSRRCISPIYIEGSVGSLTLTLREEHSLRVFENRVNNEELRDLYSSPSKIRIIKSRRMRWAIYVARMGEKRNTW